LELETREV
jgi:hypothetical protein